MNNFLGIEGRYSDLQTASYCVLPIPYERTTSYGKGTASAPEAILNASCQVELYDEELDLEPFRSGISTAPGMQFPETTSPPDCFRLIYTKARELLTGGKFLLALGGEHSISIPLVQAHVQQFPELIVLQLDAHADLREEYQGTRYSHACAMARVHEMAPVIGVGIRSLSLEENIRIREQGYPVWFAQDIRVTPRWMDDILAMITTPIYLSIDVDFFDPSIMPASGNPEPAGFYWQESMAFLRRLITEKEVIGVDVVELAPIPGIYAPEFMIARLIYKLIAFREYKRNADRFKG